MADKPTTCFRCTEAFRDKFVGTAKIRGTSGQEILQAFAEAWMRDPSALDRATSTEPSGLRETPNLQQPAPPVTTLTDETTSLLAEAESLPDQIRELRAEFAALRAEIAANRRTRSTTARVGGAHQKQPKKR